MLETVRYMLVGEKNVRDRVVVAHLRMPAHAMPALKEAIDRVALLQPAASTEKN